MGSIVLWTCGSLLIGTLAAGPAVAESAKVVLQDANGRKVGEATLEETPHGVLINVGVIGLPAGGHAFHIHETGKCEPPFTTAGGHFNPGGKKHGLKSAEGMHAGDMLNLQIPDSGSLRAEVLVTGVTLKPGTNSLFDADGSALIIHAGPDDYASDPSGNAGARIACGVVTK